MNTNQRSLSMLILTALLTLSLSNCTPGAASVPQPTLAPASLPTNALAALPPTTAPTPTIPPPTPTVLPTKALIPTATAVPTATSIPLPAITLRKGDFYFSVAGRPSFLYARNPTGKTQADFDTLLDWTRQAGSKLIRVHLTQGWWGDPWITKTGTINEAWAKNWDRLFDQADASGIYIIPVFGVWADWNNGAPDYGGALWQYNPLNAANGGPVRSPGELFQKDSATQALWLKWVQGLVTRWQARKNIAAWEIFSEVNIASGAPGPTDAKGGVDKAAGVYFTNRAASIIRDADPSHRPLTASVAGTYAENDQWAEFYAIDTIDFIEIHPYTEQLDRWIIRDVGQKLARYNKPVLIGESGLYAYPQGRAENAHRAIEHAIWASMVSGAMNGRALWDEDGYVIYARDRREAFTFIDQYASAERPAALFVKDVDFTGFKPLAAQFSASITGGAVGNETSAVGWVRDASCEPPDWNLQPLISQANVFTALPGSAPNWRVDFYDTRTGAAIGNAITVTREQNQVTIALPDFTDAIAFKMRIEP